MMNLIVWTPTGLALDRMVDKIVANGIHGSFCLLPRHVDAVVGLRSGILLYEAHSQEGYLAVHQGCLTKRGKDVTVVTLQAFEGDHLEQLAREMESLLHAADEGERRTRSALAGLESRIARGLASLETSFGGR